MIPPVSTAPVAATLALLLAFVSPLQAQQPVPHPLEPAPRVDSELRDPLPAPVPGNTQVIPSWEYAEWVEDDYGVYDRALSWKTDDPGFDAFYGEAERSWHAWDESARLRAEPRPRIPSPNR